MNGNFEIEWVILIYVYNIIIYVINIILYMNNTFSFKIN